MIFPSPKSLLDFVNSMFYDGQVSPAELRRVLQKLVEQLSSGMYLAGSRALWRIVEDTVDGDSAFCLQYNVGSSSNLYPTEGWVTKIAFSKSTGLTFVLADVSNVNISGVCAEAVDSTLVSAPIIFPPGASSISLFFNATIPSGEDANIKLEMEIERWTPGFTPVTLVTKEQILSVTSLFGGKILVPGIGAEDIPPVSVGSSYVVKITRKGTEDTYSSFFNVASAHFRFYFSQKFLGPT